MLARRWVLVLVTAAVLAAVFVASCAADSPLKESSSQRQDRKTEISHGGHDSTERHADTDGDAHGSPDVDYTDTAEESIDTSDHDDKKANVNVNVDEGGNRKYVGHGGKQEPRKAWLSWKSGASQGGLAKAPISPVETERAVAQVIEVHSDFASLQAVQEKINFGLHMPMTSAGGEPYVCFASQELSDAEARQDNGTDEDSDKEDTLQEIEKNLAALRGLCFLKRAKYWTFKVCPFDHIEQNHYEGKDATISLSLGEIVSTQYTKLENGDSAWVQTFTKGTENRETKLTIKCRADNVNFAIDAIYEPKTFVYEILAYSALACASSPELQAQQLLAPIQGQCFQRVEGWWTYELCVGKHLRQFHQYKDGRTTEYMLGEFDHQANRKLHEEADVLVTDRHTSRPYYLQKYSDGTPCDLRSNHRRSAEVHFLCNPQATVSIHTATDAAGSPVTLPTTLLSITESPTCYYVVKVQSPLLCPHSFFNEQESRTRGVLARLHCLPQKEVTDVRTSSEKKVSSASSSI